MFLVRVMLTAIYIWKKKKNLTFRAKLYYSDLIIFLLELKKKTKKRCSLSTQGAIRKLLKKTVQKPAGERDMDNTILATTSINFVILVALLNTKDKMWHQ